MTMLTGKGDRDMRPTTERRITGGLWLVPLILLTAGLGAAQAQDTAAPAAPAASTTAPAQGSKPSFEVYGFAMLDIGHNFKQINPNWFDTLRVTRLPSFEDQFCCDNSTFAGVRAMAKTFTEKPKKKK